MVVHLTEEQAAELCLLAALKGCAAEELAREAVDRYLVQESSPQSQMPELRPVAPRTEILDASEVWARMGRKLNS